jgi:phosphoglycolate phosphatase
LSPLPTSGVIFDLDGTLAATAGEIAHALNATLAELGRAAMPLADVEALIGRGVRSLVERAVARTGGPIDMDTALSRFEAHYAGAIATQAELFPGVLSGLERLRSARYPMGVVTNKPRFFTVRLLERLAIDGFFTAVVAGDDGMRPKPDGDMLIAACRKMGSDPISTLMIGDSDNDVLAARAAGCRVWCVPYGYNQGNAPETLRCDRLVATVDEAANALLDPSEK